MDTSILSLLLLQVVLIALNAVFACAEIAVISVNDNKVAKLAAEGNKRAVRLARLTSQPARFLATIQVAITLSGFLGSAFAAENFSDSLVKLLVGMGIPIPVQTLNSIAVILITLVLSYFTLVFGELVPKRVAMRKAEALALRMSAMISGISTLFAPLVWLLTVSTNTILRLLGIDPDAEDEEVGEEEIRMMVDASSEKGGIDSEEKEFIQNVFEFDDLTAGEIATHRTKLALLWLEESMEEWDHTIRDSRYTLYPICDSSADDVIGVLNAKDYFRLDDRHRASVMKHAVRPAYFVPETVKADVLFRNMKRSRNNLAVVLDEYGGLSGIVTMNDLIQQLVGEFDDEEPQEEMMLPIEVLDTGNTWKIRGDTPLEDVAELLHTELPVGEFETFGGLIFGTLGTIPQDGESVRLGMGDLEITSTEIREHQIRAAIVHRKKEGVPSESGE